LACYFSGIFVCNLWCLLIVRVNIIFCRVTLYPGVSQSGRNRALGGDFEWQGGEKNKGGDREAKQHAGGENAQPLIGH